MSRKNHQNIVQCEAKRQEAGKNGGKDRKAVYIAEKRSYSFSCGGRGKITVGGSRI